MSDPENLAEYLKRSTLNSRISGFGLDTKMHLPCPFCGEADWIAYRVLDSEPALSAGAMCKACGRAARAIFDHTKTGVMFEFVQTAGPDQPEWLEPKMRRVA